MLSKKWEVIMIDLTSELKEIKDTMKARLKAGKLDLSERYTKTAQRAIMQALEKADNRHVIRDANKEVTVKLKKQAIYLLNLKNCGIKLNKKPHTE